MTKTILDTIKEYKLKEIEKDKKLISTSDIEELAKSASAREKVLRSNKTCSENRLWIDSRNKKSFTIKRVNSRGL